MAKKMDPMRLALINDRFQRAVEEARGLEWADKYKEDVFALMDALKAAEQERDDALSTLAGLADCINTELRQVGMLDAGGAGTGADSCEDMRPWITRLVDLVREQERRGGGGERAAWVEAMAQVGRFRAVIYAAHHAAKEALQRVEQAMMDAGLGVPLERRPAKSGSPIVDPFEQAFLAKNEDAGDGEGTE